MLKTPNDFKIFELDKIPNKQARKRLHAIKLYWMNLMYSRYISTKYNESKANQTWYIEQIKSQLIIPDVKEESQ